jgi:hypothetical protein
MIANVCSLGLRSDGLRTLRTLPDGGPRLASARLNPPLWAPPSADAGSAIPKLADPFFLG